VGVAVGGTGVGSMMLTVRVGGLTETSLMSLGMVTWGVNS
jgi:hypothetical protein